MASVDAIDVTAAIDTTSGWETTSDWDRPGCSDGGEISSTDAASLSSLSSLLADAGRGFWPSGCDSWIRRWLQSRSEQFANESKKKKGIHTAQDYPSAKRLCYSRGIDRAAPGYGFSRA